MEIIQPVVQPRYVQMVIFCRIGPTSVGRPTPVTKAAVTAIVLLLWVGGPIFNAVQLSETDGPS